MATTGFELILPFLRPIQHLILDPEISEIMVNGPEHVFIERAGRVEGVPGLTLSPKSRRVFSLARIPARISRTFRRAGPKHGYRI
jgi:pilus assembly protein CpaF